MFYNYEDDEFYDLDYDDCEEYEHEPCEFADEIEALKTAVKETIKKQVIEEMEKLRAENIALRDYRDKYSEYQRELDRLKHEYEVKASNAKKEAERKRFNDIMADCCVTMYRVKTNYIKAPKCDKCDNDRKIHYISPMGRKTWEYCLCDRNINIYEPEVAKCIRFTVNRDSIGQMVFRRKEKDDYDIYEYTACARDKDTPFDEINMFYDVFAEQETCQAYCDWLTAKEQKRNSN